MCCAWCTLAIRRLTGSNQDWMDLRWFFHTISHETLMSYGRFSEEERIFETMDCCKEICDGLKARTEIGFAYFAEEGNYPIGYLHFNLSNKWSRKGYQASLGIVVHDSYQHQGIGSTLLKYGLEQMRELGYKKIWLHVHASNLPAIELYRKFGFRAEGVFVRDEIFDGKLIDTISMARFLG